MQDTQASHGLKFKIMVRNIFLNNVFLFYALRKYNQGKRGLFTGFIHSILKNFKEKHGVEFESEQPLKAILDVHIVSQKYMSVFVYKWYANWCRLRRRHIIINLLWENGKLILVLATPIWEEEFDPESKSFKNGTTEKILKKYYIKRQKIANLIGVDVKLPSARVQVEKALDICKDYNNTQTIVAGICRALEVLIRHKGLVKDDTIFFLFSDNKQLSEKLFYRMVNVHNYLNVLLIESVNKNRFKDEISPVLDDYPYVIVDLSGNLQEYVPYFHEHTIVLYESYPAVDPVVANMVHAYGGEVYRILGTKGFLWVPFGGDYLGYIPLCASSIKDGDDNYEIVIGRIKVVTDFEGRLQNEFKEIY